MTTNYPNHRFGLCYCSANPDHTNEDYDSILNDAVSESNCPNCPSFATMDFVVVVDTGPVLPLEQYAVLVFVAVGDLSP